MYLALRAGDVDAAARWLTTTADAGERERMQQAIATINHCRAVRDEQVHQLMAVVVATYAS